jgi:hypothetical protein
MVRVVLDQENRFLTASADFRVLFLGYRHGGDLG